MPFGYPFDLVEKLGVGENGTNNHMRIYHYTDQF